MTLLGIVALGIYSAALLQVGAQDSLVKLSTESVTSSDKDTVKDSQLDTNILLVDDKKEVVWDEVRNLFAPKGAESMPSQGEQQPSSKNKDTAASASDEIRIIGIISGKDSKKNRAIINGMVVQRGDRLNDFLVEEITSATVTFRKGGKPDIRKFKPYQNPARQNIPDSGPQKGSQGKGRKEIKPNVKP
ncbi:MAG: hypothetical protein ACOYM3_00045 [Terrimicrobiaceae bacterium]